jgi:hypothetical protein
MLSIKRVFNKLMLSLGYRKFPIEKKPGHTCPNSMYKEKCPIYVLGSCDPIDVWHNHAPVSEEEFNKKINDAGPNDYDGFSGTDCRVSIDGKESCGLNAISWKLVKGKKKSTIKGTMIAYLIASPEGHSLELLKGVHTLETFYKNEYGHGIKFIFKGVHFVDMSQGSSVDDIITEAKFTWTATSITKQ